MYFCELLMWAKQRHDLWEMTEKEKTQLSYQWYHINCRFTLMKIESDTPINISNTEHHRLSNSSESHGFARLLSWKKIFVHFVSFSPNICVKEYIIQHCCRSRLQYWRAPLSLRRQQWSPSPSCSPTFSVASLCWFSFQSLYSVEKTHKQKMLHDVIVS